MSDADEIEAAADRYEHLALEGGGGDDTERQARDGDESGRDAASDRDASERTSSSSSNEREEDAAPPLAMGGDFARDAERLSCVSLGDWSTARAAEPPVDILRPTEHGCACAASPPIAMLSAPPRGSQPPALERFTPADTTHGSHTLSSTPLAPDDASPTCGSAACREHAKWKDARIRELQRALDHMVDAMAIQQRDLAAQSAFLARQSEQCMRLAATLQHEKLALQIERERERAQRAARGGGTPTGAAAAAGSHPSTPSSRRSTPRAGASAKKLKSVLSTLAGVSPRGGERRSPSAAVDARSSSWRASSRSASESKLAPVAIPLSDPLVRAADDSNLAATMAEERRSLAALEVRATLPEAPVTPAGVAMAAKSQAAAAALSDVSLQDSPVRVGSRSATNDMAAVVVAAATSSTATSSAGSGSSKKASLGERFRNLRWK